MVQLLCFKFIVVWGVDIMNNEATLESTNSISIRKVLYISIKRLFDIVLSLIGCLCLLPVALIVKISYILNKDYASIFFSQERIGKNGKTFKFYKFRSMVVNADKVLEELLKNDKDARKEYKLNKKLKNDPRITKMGKILRRTSLDELPQFINVLRGDMSLIGNRPYLPREKEDMGTYYDTIVKTKPGLTGYWQVNGRSNTTFEERLKLEEYYSSHAGLKMDIKILFKTVYVVLFHKGAE